MMADGQENMRIKIKLSKLHCPFTWEILDSMIKHFTITAKNDEFDQMVDNETSYPLERLLISLFICYKAVLSADDDEATKSIEKAGQILMEIQQQYDTQYLFIYVIILRSLNLYYYCKITGRNFIK